MSLDRDATGTTLPSRDPGALARFLAQP